MTGEMQSQLKCVIGDDYPLPIIDEKKSRLEGVNRSYKARGSAEVRKTSKRINKKHGSRKKPNKLKKKTKGRQTKFT